MRGLNMMEYKGYIGIVEYDSAAKLFHGDVVNTRDVITFQGTTVEEIVAGLYKADEYVRKYRNA